MVVHAGFPGNGGTMQIMIAAEVPAENYEKFKLAIELAKARRKRSIIFQRIIEAFLADHYLKTASLRNSVRRLRTMNANEWEKVDEEFDFIIDSAESAQGTDKIEDVNEALDDIYRSIGRIKKITNGLERKR